MTYLLEFAGVNGSLGLFARVNVKNNFPLEYLVANFP